MLMTSSGFIFSFSNFCVIVSFLTKLLTFGISFLTVMVIAKLVISDILFLPSFILALRAVVAAKLVILAISF